MSDPKIQVLVTSQMTLGGAQNSMTNMSAMAKLTMKMLVTLCMDFVVVTAIITCKRCNEKHLKLHGKCTLEKDEAFFSLYKMIEFLRKNICIICQELTYGKNISLLEQSQVDETYQQIAHDSSQEDQNIQRYQSPFVTIHGHITEVFFISIFVDAKIVQTTAAVIEIFLSHILGSFRYV